mmetsp:Transcript_69383/g.225312  ORF Transcript_69383/g.225312 Transcript_69383/m.225312 type:complete len:291 (+) Transcript_69383:232-1104(+)
MLLQEDELGHPPLCFDEALRTRQQCRLEVFAAAAPQEGSLVWRRFLRRRFLRGHTPRRSRAVPLGRCRHSALPRLRLLFAVRRLRLLPLFWRLLLVLLQVLRLLRLCQSVRRRRHSFLFLLLLTLLLSLLPLRPRDRPALPEVLQYLLHLFRLRHRGRRHRRRSRRRHHRCRRRRHWLRFGCGSGKRFHFRRFVFRCVGFRRLHINRVFCRSLRGIVHIIFDYANLRDIKLVPFLMHLQTLLVALLAQAVALATAALEEGALDRLALATAALDANMHLGGPLRTRARAGL